MADGAQRGFAFHAPGVSLLRPGEIVVDLFAGGGGASEALRQALGRDPDICINHDAWAIGMHAANHPLARHLCEDVWHANPRRECAGRHVGWLHASPDCTHFSQAKGGQPRSRATRSLSWVVLKWAGAVRPRVISLENVEQILKWGPLVAKRDPATGRALRLDGAAAAPGERVPIDEQFLIPDKRHAGRTWRAFVAALRQLGYTVEWRKVRACDHGAGTSRTRLFMVARCDGDPIRWPEPTHGTGRAHPYVTAADSIDWSTPCPSIFTRKKPLADATCRRIARGIKRYVIEAAEPFIVPATHHGSDRINGLREPLPTITAAQRGELMLVAPTLIQASHGEGQGPTQRRGSGAHDPQAPLGTVHAGGGSFGIAAATLVQRYGEREGQEPRAVEVARPMPTIVPTDNGASLVTAFLEQANTGLVGHDAREPLSTIVGKGCTQRIVAANLVTMRNNADGQPATDPLGTVCAGTVHHGVVECRLSPEAETSALRVAAFLVNYYGNGTALDLRESIDTITTRDRLALVTVTIRGTPYVIVDIGLRMLKPVELYRAQGFPADYIIDRTADGRLINGTRAVRMVGNSVSPPPLAAIARANLDPVESLRAAA